MADHPIFAEDMQEIVESFVVETQEIFDDLDNDLVLLEQNPHDTALIDKIFRAVHTVKGTAGFLSLEQLSYLTHHFEDVLNRLRRGELAFRPGMMDVMLRAFDVMKVLLQQVVDQELVSVDLEPILAQLEAVAQGIDLKVPDAPVGSSASYVPAPASAEMPAETAPTPAAASATPAEASGPTSSLAPDALPASVLNAPQPSAEKLANHPVFAEDMQEIVESFVVETQEIFDDLDNDLVLLEQNPHDTALIDKIFRAVHTVKGTAGFLSLEQLSYLTHHFEDVLNRLRRDELTFRPGMMDVMLRAFDVMKVLAQQVFDQRLVPIDLTDALVALHAVATGAAIPSARTTEPSAPPAASAATEAPATEAPATEAPASPAPAASHHAPAGNALPASVAEAPYPSAEELANHPMFSADMQEIVESFVVESQEMFDDLDNDLVLLEQNPHDTALIDKIFRAVHTVKGTAGFLNFEQLSYLTHHFEDVLNRLRRDELAFRPDLMDVMLRAFDVMRVFVQQVIDQRLEPVDLTDVLLLLHAIVSGEPLPAVGAKAAPSPSPAQPSAAAETVPTDAAPADQMPSAEASGAEASGRAPTKRASTETIRVEVERLDNLMNLVGELVLGRNRLMQLISDMDDVAEAEELQRELADTSAQVDFITTELQAAVMHTRMVQIGRVFNKFPRVIRDLAKEFDKQIDLEMEGQETELDKSLIEEIGDPMVHLIRNACDHGIEMPEDRLANGKPARGTVRLSAAHEGNNIVIEIADDGAGIDPEKLKAIALKKGLISATEAAEMSDTEAYQLIFRPGFSTAEKVSKVSGRGVGMDVVKTNITKLNGTISIHSELGKGSRFVLKLPLTLAIIQSLLVRVAQETYAIPLHSVSEVVGLAPEDIKSINGREVIRIREDVLPLLRIDSTLDVDRAEPRPRDGYAVVVQIGHQRLGLVADSLIGQKEIVIKPLGSYLKKVPGIAGSTILGDGRVIMILDIAEAIRIEAERRTQPSGERGTVLGTTLPA